MQEFMTYEEYLRDVKKGIVTDLGNCPVQRFEKRSGRDDILKYALEKYETIPDHPWMSLPGYAVLRHKGNNKWYGIIMDVKNGKKQSPAGIRNGSYLQTPNTLILKRHFPKAILFYGNRATTSWSEILSIFM